MADGTEDVFARIEAERAEEALRRAAQEILDASGSDPE